LSVSRGVIVAAVNKTKMPEVAHYSPAEQRLVDLKVEMDKIRLVYMTLMDFPDKAPGVNKDSRQLAERFLAVDDADLSVGIQIYKYEGAAYSWAMVAG